MLIRQIDDNSHYFFLQKQFLNISCHFLSVLNIKNISIDKNVFNLIIIIIIIIGDYLRKIDWLKVLFVVPYQSYHDRVIK